MAKRKKSQPKKKKRQPKTGSPLQQLWQKFESVDKTVLLYWAGFGVFLLLFHLLTLQPFYETNIQEPTGAFFAAISSGLLNLLGQGTTADGLTISSDAYSLLIKRGCDAITATVILIATILVFPASWPKKWKGIAFGVLFLFALNVVRIVSLYFVGVHAPEHFEFMHIEFWQFAFIALAIAYFIYWLNWGPKTTGHAQTA